MNKICTRSNIAHCPLQLGIAQHVEVIILIRVKKEFVTASIIFISRKKTWRANVTEFVNVTATASGSDDTQYADIPFSRMGRILNRTQT